MEDFLSIVGDPLFAVIQFLDFREIEALCASQKTKIRRWCLRNQDQIYKYLLFRDYHIDPVTVKDDPKITYNRLIGNKLWTIDSVNSMFTFGNDENILKAAHSSEYTITIHYDYISLYKGTIFFQSIDSMSFCPSLITEPLNLFIFNKCTIAAT